MAASSPMSTMSGPTLAHLTTNSASGQVSAAVDTPMSMSSAPPNENSKATLKSNDTSANATTGPAITGSSSIDPVDLFDQSLFPTFQATIRSISVLLDQASKDVDSLSIPQSAIEEDTSMNEDRTKNVVIASQTLRPDIVMGATTEDDVTSGYDAALFLPNTDTQERGKVQATELAHEIVRQSQSLRSAFQRAQVAINKMPGGEMDLEEQESLINLLQDYKNEQRWSMKGLVRNDNMTRN